MENARWYWEVLRLVIKRNVQAYFYLVAVPYEIVPLGTYAEISVSLPWPKDTAKILFLEGCPVLPVIPFVHVQYGFDITARKSHNFSAACVSDISCNRQELSHVMFMHGDRKWSVHDECIHLHECPQ